MRTLAPAAAAALASGAVGLAILVDMNLTVPLRLASSAVTLIHDGIEYVGAGALGNIDKVSDAPGEIKPLRFVLSGVPTELLAIALDEPFRNRRCRVRLAILDPDTQAMLDAPVTWTGTLDQMPVSHQTDEEGKTTGTISVTAEHRGATFGRPKPLRYTNSDQRKLFAPDTSLRFITIQASHKDIWPAAGFGRQ